MRMEALSLRLGVQGQAGRPRRRVRSTPAVRPGPGEPAVADGLRYAAVSASAPTGRTVAAGPTALTWMTSPTRRRGTSSSGRSRIRNGCSRARRGNRSPSGLRRRSRRSRKHCGSAARVRTQWSTFKSGPTWPRWPSPTPTTWPRDPAQSLPRNLVAPALHVARQGQRRFWCSRRRGPARYGEHSGSRSARRTACGPSRPCAPRRSARTGSRSAGAPNRSSTRRGQLATGTGSCSRVDAGSGATTWPFRGCSKDLEIGAVPHRFHSTFRDGVAEETNHPREVIEAALPHVVQNKVEATNARRHNRVEPPRTTSFPCPRQRDVFRPAVFPLPARGCAPTGPWKSRGRSLLLVPAVPAARFPRPTPHQNLWVYRTFEDSRRSSV